MKIMIKKAEAPPFGGRNPNRSLNLNLNQVHHLNNLTDQQLLGDYTGRRSEAAFAELVRRHVDFVYSAALRMVRDAHLAEDVTQSVFVALAQNDRRLSRGLCSRCETWT